MPIYSEQMLKKPHILTFTVYYKNKEKGRMSTLSELAGTTSTTGAKSDTECFVNASGNYLAGENGLFAFDGTCYYS